MSNYLKFVLFVFFLITISGCVNKDVNKEENKEKVERYSESKGKKEKNPRIKNKNDTLISEKLKKNKDPFIKIFSAAGNHFHIRKNPEVISDQPLTIEKKDVFNYLDFYPYPLTEYYKDIDVDNINEAEILDLFSLKVDSFIERESQILKSVEVKRNEVTALISGKLDDKKLFIKYILVGVVGGTHAIVEMRALFPNKVDDDILEEVLSSFKAKEPLFYGSSD